jgi:AcrR family transcriptional regulator
MRTPACRTDDREVPKRSVLRAPAGIATYRPVPVGRYGGVSAEQRQAQRRDRLLTAAVELFGTRGYADTTIQALCDKAGVALRTFYEEFGSREALLATVYDRISESVLAKTHGAIEGAGNDPRAVVRAGVTAYVEAITSDVKTARILIIETVGVSPALEKRRREVLNAFVKSTEAAALALRDRLPVVEGDDFATMARAFVGAADGLASEWLLSRGRLSAKRISDMLILMWMRTLRLER